MYLSEKFGAGVFMITINKGENFFLITLFYALFIKMSFAKLINLKTKRMIRP